MIAHSGEDAGGNANWYSHYENLYGDSSRSWWSSVYPEFTVPLWGLYPKGYPAAERYLLIQVHCYYIHNSQKLETALMSFDELRMKMWHTYTMRYYSAVKKTELWN